ncbi:hypothetical protein GOP47_0021546 [Adiantum capillus-veneris]|uniref:SigF-like NTF2-like domain-containing protein n=1 Tax=Adiantum capillus-veneris TaxID=13818 RepID=A0A9D4U9H3_ADICA|nr:hypothetical protein GOP47_0021546 [Adiantum capillus-veneris]
MEDPREDVKTVIQQLVCRPTLQQQAEALRTYFTPDVQFYHFYINIAGGRRDLTAIYQMAEFLFNYQAVKFHDIVYDEFANAVAVNMTVYIRPWLAFYTEHHNLVFFILLELENHIREDGKKVKLIKVQRDFFERSPSFLLLPFIGRAYNSVWLRVLLGHAIVIFVRSLRFVASVFFPDHM